MGMHRQFEIIGRLHPHKHSQSPILYRMKIWASDSLRARSKFWFFLRKLQRIRKTKGHVVYCQAIFERKPAVAKFFGLWANFASRTGNHSTFKEYRDLLLNGAVEQLYTDIASRHKTPTESIQIIKTVVVAHENCKSNNALSYQDKKIRVPLFSKTLRASRKQYKNVFKHKRPAFF